MITPELLQQIEALIAEAQPDITGTLKVISTSPDSVTLLNDHYRYNLQFRRCPDSYIISRIKDHLQEMKTLKQALDLAKTVPGLIVTDDYQYSTSDPTIWDWKCSFWLVSQIAYYPNDLLSIVQECQQRHEKAKTDLL